MFNFSKISVLLALTASFAAAAVDDAAAPPCVNGLQTYNVAVSTPRLQAINTQIRCSIDLALLITLKFDKLKPNTAVPDGFTNMDWYGFTTVDPLAAGYHVTPSSSKLVAKGPSALGSYFTGFAELKSFRFACVGFYIQDSSTGNLPIPCAVQVVTLTNFPPYDIENYGPYYFSVNYTEIQNGKNATMAKAVPTGAAGFEIHFLITTASSASAILLVDNVIVAKQC